MLSENKKEFPFPFLFRPTGGCGPNLRSLPTPPRLCRQSATALRPQPSLAQLPTRLPGPLATMALRQPARSPSGPGAAVRRGHDQDAAAGHPWSTRQGTPPEAPI
jgi:hypothetical protein